jgi:hypothetical protein
LKAASPHASPRAYEFSVNSFQPSVLNREEKYGQKVEIGKWKIDNWKVQLGKQLISLYKFPISSF